MRRHGRDSGEGSKKREDSGLHVVVVGNCGKERAAATAARRKLIRAKKKRNAEEIQ